jgi:polysaccharide deacetylase 2 family uncharacterized protein YibQ
VIRQPLRLLIVLLLLLPATGGAQPAEAHRLLLIIDDLGHPIGRARVEACFALPQAVAFSIIPGTPQASAVARRCARQGRDVLAHLPWEPLRRELSGERLLAPVDCDESRHEAVLARSRRELPRMVAASNHQGSRASGDERFLAAFARAWSPLGLPFVDSRTAHDSRIPAMLGAAGVPVFENQLFLDHVDEETAIRAELARLLEIARGRELTIAIAHPRLRSLRLLADWLEKLPADICLVEARAALAAPPPPRDWLAQTRAIVED